MAVTEMAEAAPAEVDSEESASSEMTQTEAAPASESTGEQTDAQEEYTPTSEEIMELLEFREQRAERARQAEASAGKDGQPQGGAQSAQAAPQAAPAPVPVGPFKMTEEMKRAFGEEGDFEGGFNAFGEHLVGQVRASRDEIVGDALGALYGELEKAMGGIQARMMAAAEHTVEMRLFLNPKIYPENADIAAFGVGPFSCAMRQAYREMPDASVDKWQERAAEIIRKDGVRALKAIKSGNVIDVRPGRKPASDSPHVGGGAPVSSDKKSDKTSTIHTWEQKAESEWKWR